MLIACSVSHCNLTISYDQITYAGFVFSMQVFLNRWLRACENNAELASAPNAAMGAECLAYGSLGFFLFAAAEGAGEKQRQEYGYADHNGYGKEETSDAEAGIVNAASASRIWGFDAVVTAEAGEVAQRNAQRLAGVFVLIVHAGDALDGVAADFIHEYLSPLGA